jgi:peptidoglycan/LPS O-acetylase OafA/YrhL
MLQHEQRIPYLDGVRGIAILLVFVAHLLEGVSPGNVRLLPWVTHGGGGGLIGVQLFFVLSGFLITSILKREFEKTGTISFRNFYWRRFWRLVPALVVVCIAAIVMAWFVLPREQFKATLGSVALAITYTTNLEKFMPPFPNNGWLSHTWSLSVEEQFYLVWPLVMLMCVRKSKAMVHAAIGVGFAAAIVFRALPLNEALDVSLFRWDALMVGCLLAFWQPRLSRWVTVLGVVIIAGYAMHYPNPTRNYHYVLCAVGSGLFLLYAAKSKWVANPVLVYFGKISYGLYLWHVLIGRLGLPGYVTLAGGIIVAELSHRFLEAPILAWSRRGKPPSRLAPSSIIAPAVEAQRL